MKMAGSFAKDVVACGKRFCLFFSSQELAESRSAFRLGARKERRPGSNADRFGILVGVVYDRDGDFLSFTLADHFKAVVITARVSMLRVMIFAAGLAVIGAMFFVLSDPSVPGAARAEESNVGVGGSRADLPSWPNWMGQRHDGISDETGWSPAWPASGLKVVWQRQVGIGFSSVSIAQGRLFTMGHSEGNETVFCLDQGTGKTIWSHTYPSKLVDNLYEGGPGATPTIDGNKVYTVGKEGQLICFGAADG